MQWIELSVGTIEVLSNSFGACSLISSTSRGAGLTVMPDQSVRDERGKINLHSLIKKPDRNIDNRLMSFPIF